MTNTNEPITITLRRGQWMVLIAAESDYNQRVPRDQGDGGACLDVIQAALNTETTL